MAALHYDAVVIGAGNGGLAAALTLVNAGKKVLLAERHNLPGGFATSFIRGRFEFEASLHELCDMGTPGNSGNLYDLFEELGVLDKIKFVTVPEAYRGISLSTGEDYTMPFGIENFIDKMESYVPGSRESTTTFFELAGECRRAMSYLTKSRGNPDTAVLKSEYPNFMRVAAYPIDKVLDAIKMPKKAQEILNVYWSYLGTPEDQLSFLHYALMVWLYVSLGAQVPKNRSHGISCALADTILEKGGEIWYNSEVEHIITKDGHVAGVRFADGKEVATEHIVSNASPHLVYGSMVDAKDIPEEELKLANARGLAGRGVSMFLGLNKSHEELGLNDYSYFIYNSFDTKAEFRDMRSIENPTQVTVCLNNALPDCSPKGTTILYFTSLYFSDFFGDIATPENYFELKDKIADRLIDAFEKGTGAKIRDAIEEIEVGTPVTYAHYTGSPQGAIYGYLLTGLDNMMPRVMRMYDEKHLPGLQFCGGHAMRGSGYNSSYLSGNLAAKLTLMEMKKEAE